MLGNAGNGPHKQKYYMRIGVSMLFRTGSVPARAWRGQAVGIARTERLKLRRHIAAAAEKKESVSLSLSWKLSMWKLRKNFPPRTRLHRRKVSGWEDGEESIKKLGASRFSRFRRGDTKRTSESRHVRDS